MANSSEICWLQNSSGEDLTISVNLSLYTKAALFRVCYLFTDKCYLFLEPKGQDLEVVHVRFSAKSPNISLKDVAGEFANELINQRVREDIARETGPIRELIVAQAFAEADLLDKTDAEESYLDDPRGIAR